MPSTFTAHRATATDITLSLGLLSIRVDLLAASPSARESYSFKMACPICEGPVSQRYICTDHPVMVQDHDEDDDSLATRLAIAGLLADLGDPDTDEAELRAANRDHGLIEPGDCIRTRREDVLDEKGNVVRTDTVKATPDEMVKAAVGDLAKNVMHLAVHPSDQVETTCRPATKGYLMRPARTKGNISATDEQLYGLLREFHTSHPELCLVGSLRLKDTRSVYRITTFDGQLFLEELVLPADLRDRDVIDVDVQADHAEQFAKLAKANVEDFDPEAHRWDRAAAVARLVKAKREGKELVESEAPARMAELDLDALLTQALAGSTAPAA